MSMSRHDRRKPFQSWRVLAQSGGQQFAVDSEPRTFGGIGNGGPPCLPEFDEVVVREPYIHVERMAARSCYVGLGDVKLAVSLDRSGKIKVVLYEGKLDPKTGVISVPAPAALSGMPYRDTPLKLQKKKPRGKR
jgi:hypothetical protein